MYEFKLILSGADALTPEMADSLYQKIDDATAGSCNGDVTVDFHREASSLRDAVLSAVADIEGAGFKVARAENDDLLALQEINSALAQSINGDGSVEAVAS